MPLGEAADRLDSSDFVRVVAHADADGVSSAACLCSALADRGVGYQFTTLEHPEDCADAEGDLFCDLGAQYLSDVSGVVVDHHPPRGENEGAVVVGSDAPSSSVAAHALASRLSSGDPVAALVGALGDDVPFADVSDTVDEALSEGVQREQGARLVGDGAESLAYSTRPFTRLSGDTEAARAFFEDVEDDLSTAAVLLALSREPSNPGAVAELVGDVYRLPSGVHLHELSRYVEACAVSGRGGLAFSACLEPGAHLEEASSVWRGFESTLIEDVRGVRTVDENPCFAYHDGASDTGAVADALHDWVTGDVVAVGEGEASFRARGFDCGRVAAEAAERTGGEGGGHGSRAGASFEASRDGFVEAVEEVLA